MNEVVIYKTADHQTEVEVRFEGETVWLNQKRLEQLQQVVNVIQQSGSLGSLQLNEAKGLLEILSNYTRSFVLLNQYDSHNLQIGKLR